MHSFSAVLLPRFIIVIRCFISWKSSTFKILIFKPFRRGMCIRLNTYYRNYHWQRRIRKYAHSSQGSLSKWVKLCSGRVGSSHNATDLIKADWHCLMLCCLLEAPPPEPRETRRIHPKGKQAPSGQKSGIISGFTITPSILNITITLSWLEICGSRSVVLLEMWRNTVRRSERVRFIIT